jgi:glucose/arabinose dehydrogenase
MKKLLNFAVLALCSLIPVHLFGQGVAAPYTPRLQPRLTGLSRPLLVRHAGDGSKRLFIVQQTGLIRVVQPGSSTATTFIDLTSKIVIPGSSGDERGLLGLTFHPQFASNGKFYVDYTRAGDGATVIAEYRVSANDPNQADTATERILITIPQPFTNHNGGMVEFGPDGFMYIGMGDGGSGNDPGNRAQNRSVLLGKILRIDVNVPQGSGLPYSIPATNPFTGNGTSRCDGGSTTAGTTCQEPWTIGMRNPWRYSFDAANGQLWVADVGQGATEEVDVITSGGGNYGWRVYEGTQCTGNDPGLCNPANYIMPLFQYSHTSGRCSITGGYVYRGTQNSLPSGVYTFGDYCSGEVFVWQNNQQVLLQDTPRQILSFGQDEDNELYIAYSNGQIDKITRARASADLDGDLKSDFAVYRPSTGVWYVLNSSNNSVRIQSFGIAEDIAAPEDYDGDNITDIGVFRPSTGSWYFVRSSDSTVGSLQFGSAGDVPAAGDYDGDAKADFTVFRPSTGAWYTLRSTDNSVSSLQFGLNGDVPTPGDFDADGKYDIAVWRPSDGVWYRLNSTNGQFSAVQFGLNGDVPAAGDFDGDGRSDNAVFRPSTGVWYILQSSNGSVQGLQWGTNGDVPGVGDYDGDGKDDVAVFRPNGGLWYVLKSTNGSLLSAQFGAQGDQPAATFDAP